MFVENIIIGKPIVSFEEFFCNGIPDTAMIEREKTIWTNERFLPKILGGEIEASVEENGEKSLIKLGIALSVSEVRRNRKDLVKELNYLDFLEIKYGKRKIFILVGEDDANE